MLILLWQIPGCENAPRTPVFLLKETRMKHTLLIMIVFFAVLNGCTSGTRFHVCPSEIAEKMKAEADIGQRKELLWDLIYIVLVVHKSLHNVIVPVQHYRSEHTFGNRIHPIEVSFDKPQAIGAQIIVADISAPKGIAVKKFKDKFWRIYWLKDTDIDEIRKTGVVYLPPYKKLPLKKQVNR